MDREQGIDADRAGKPRIWPLDGRLRTVAQDDRFAHSGGKRIFFHMTDSFADNFLCKKHIRSLCRRTDTILFYSCLILSVELVRGKRRLSLTEPASASKRTGLASPSIVPSSSKQEVQHMAKAQRIPLKKGRKKAPNFSHQKFRRVEKPRV